MMLDFEDLTAIRDLIDRAERRAAAGAIRVQAHPHHTRRREYAGALLTLADDIETGVMPVPAGPVRMVLVPEEVHDEFLDAASKAAMKADEEAVAAEEERGQVVQPVTEANGELVALHGIVGGEPHELTTEMLEWLDLFDDRLRASEHFVEAVNEAAEAGLPLTAGAAHLVGERIRELRASSVPAAEQVEDEAALLSRGMRARTPEPAPDEPEEA